MNSSSDERDVAVRFPAAIFVSGPQMDTKKGQGTGTLH